MTDDALKLALGKAIADVIGGGDPESLGELYSGVPLPSTFTQCQLRHCFTCGDHHDASGHYCGVCLRDRLNHVISDARVRGHLRDYTDHRYWHVNHEPHQPPTSRENDNGATYTTCDFCESNIDENAMRVIVDIEHPTYLTRDHDDWIICGSCWCVAFDTVAKESYDRKDHRDTGTPGCLHQ